MTGTDNADTLCWLDDFDLKAPSRLFEGEAGRALATRRPASTIAWHMAGAVDRRYDGDTGTRGLHG
nr:hypothetical protein [Burkholderia cepacia]